ncbi:MAG: HEAT repeat domain-containing protein, partial [Myxococcales bacterium]|nr:HEAT repeat domain-containing protein [Myxococcales bacterium]
MGERPLTEIALGSEVSAAPKGRVHYAPDRLVDIRHLRIELDVVPKAGTIRGNVTLDVVARAVEVHEIELHAAELVIDKAEIDGQPARFRHHGETLALTLAKPLSSGATAKVRVHYHGKPRVGLYFVLPDKDHPKRPVSVFSQGETHTNRFWYPAWDFPNMRFTSELLVTVPKPLRALSNGEPQPTKDNGTTRTFHFKLMKPHSNYLVSLVIGEFAEYTQSWDGIPITSYVAPQDKSLAPLSFRNTAFMMQLFSKLTGVRYPWGRYGQVTVPRYMHGGMENTSLTTLTRDALHDERLEQDIRSDGLVAHELAHQWFGDLVTCRDWSHIWLNESFATYFSQLYHEAKYGANEFDFRRYRTLAWYWEDPPGQPIVSKRYKGTWERFGSHTYAKGAAVLHMLRRELGDSTFFAGIKLYLTRHAFKNVESSDLRKAFEEVSGRNLEPFFDQWLRRDGHPIVRFSWTYEATDKLVVATVEQTQKEAAFTMRAPLVLTDAKGRRTIQMVTLRRKHEVLRIPASGAPTLVELDPRGDLLMKLTVKKGAPELVIQLQRGSQLLSRVRAATALGRFPNHEPAYAALEALLKSETEYWGLPRSAADALARMRTRRACSILLAALSVKRSRVRSHVAEGLGHCATINPLKALEKVLNHDNSWFTRAAAASAIGRLRDKRSLTLLERALKQSEALGMVQLAALRGIARLEDPRGIKVIKAFIEKRSNPRRSLEQALVSYAKLLYI